MSKKKLLFGGGLQNTFIGGIGSTITTASLLASLLGISVNRILNFEVVGTEVRCRIVGSYEIPTAAFLSNSAITFYEDKDNLITKINFNSFNNTKVLSYDFKGVLTVEQGGFGFSTSEEVFLENCIDFNTGFNLAGMTKLTTAYIPRVTNLGGSALDNNVFSSGTAKAGLIIYANPSLATNNGGLPDGDLQYAVTNGATVRYVTNFDKPSKVTTFSVTETYNTAIRISITAPSSTNPIDFYNIWINGKLFKKRFKSGDYLLGLLKGTNYNLQIIAVDEFYNLAPLSDILNFNTTATTTDFSSALFAYYKLESNLNDSKGSNNGTTTSVSYAAGKVNNGMVFNGSSSFGNIPDANDFSFTDGTNNRAGAIGFYYKFNGISSQYLVNKLSNASTSLEHYVVYDGTNLRFRIFSNNSPTNYISRKILFTPTIGAWYLIVASTDGSGTSSGMQLSINVVESSIDESLGTFVRVANTTSPTVIGKQGFASAAYANGEMDCLSFFNKKLNLGEISDMKAIFDSGNDLI